MGMYTGLRCKLKIKKEYRDEIHHIISNNKDWSECSIPILKAYSLISRSSFIPYGSLSYMDWDPKDEKFCRIDKDTGIFAFQCSLKNYEGTIEAFIYNVVPEICEEIYLLEEHYEEDFNSKVFFFDDNHKIYYKKVLTNIIEIALENNVSIEEVVTKKSIRKKYYGDYYDGILNKDYNFKNEFEALKFLIKERKVKE